MNMEGDVIDSIGGAEPHQAVLRMHGWRSHGPAEAWNLTSEALSALDWNQILRRLHANRTQAKAVEKEADRRLRLAIREALTAGIPVSTIVEETRLTRQRIYQIRRSFSQG